MLLYQKINLTTAILAAGTLGIIIGIKIPDSFFFWSLIGGGLIIASLSGKLSIRSLKIKELF